VDAQDEDEQAAEIETYDEGGEEVPSAGDLSFLQDSPNGFTDTLQGMLDENRGGEIRRPAVISPLDGDVLITEIKKCDAEIDKLSEELERGRGDLMDFSEAEINDLLLKTEGAKVHGNSERPLSHAGKNQGPTQPLSGNWRATSGYPPEKTSPESFDY